MRFDQGVASESSSNGSSSIGLHAAVDSGYLGQVLERGCGPGYCSRA
jgi:hypothetical protein